MKTNTHMLKTIFVSLILSFYFLYPSFLNWEESEHVRFKKAFKWFTLEEYVILHNECLQNKVPIENMLATIQLESEGNPNALHYNTNGTTDYGLCQVNTCRRENYSDEELLSLSVNIHLGVKAYKEAWYKSRGDVITASRFYNAGLNSKEQNYKNWGYPKGVERNIASIENKDIFYDLYKNFK